ncbi:DUF3592 domain-containing protein [Hymenobacter puniceus]|uniref:DUF3592 domain-containing protein n=1 Tax=Hymenobacter sp. BT190 TaxID=2763505 RepID=UPI001651AC09|nr:DUF3592 domain-containing protein [Hymenobacter sp. BT190]MBC6699428.1 hypothetical protein [Hymenobacter sp. BT190]
MDFSTDMLAPLALFLASPFFFISAYKERRNRLFFQQQGIQVEGIIIRIEEELDSEDNTTYLPIIGVFINQQWISLRYECGNAFSSFKTGQTVAIRYNRENINDFIVIDDEKTWFEWLFAAVGTGFLLVSLIWWIRLQASTTLP